MIGASGLAEAAVHTGLRLYCKALVSVIGPFLKPVSLKIACKEEYS